jgi:hypothetical protein
MSTQHKPDLDMARGQRPLDEAQSGFAFGALPVGLLRDDERGITPLLAE